MKTVGIHVDNYKYDRYMTMLKNNLYQVISTTEMPENTKLIKVQIADNRLNDLARHIKKTGIDIKRAN